MARMTKAEIANYLSQTEPNLSQAVVRRLLTELEELARVELSSAGEFHIPGIVRLKVQTRKERMGHNPTTGQELLIPAGQVVRAKVSRRLAQNIGA